MDRALYIDDDISVVSGLTGKSILVTGSGSGIGRSASLILAQSGAKLVLADRNEVEGRETEAMILASGGIAAFIHTDVASEASVEAAVAFAVHRYGRIDGALNNAGVPQFGKLHEITDAEFRRVLDVNLLGVFYCLKHELVQMMKSGGGSIVNMSSIAGITAVGENAAYCASKHGVIGLTLTVAHDYGAMGIRANVVCPGVIRTPMVEQAGDSDRIKHRIRQVPANRAGEPREVGQLAAWLLSDGASYLSGVTMPVDGGLMAGPYYRV